MRFSRSAPVPHAGPAPSSCASSPQPPGRRGFTLIELVIVMTMLLIVLGVAYPALSGFFRGRTLDSEARRFVALTRYAQSRAVSEGIPMILWIDASEGLYGLEAQAGFLTTDAKAVEFPIDNDVRIEVAPPLLSTTANSRTAARSTANSIPMMRFTPDGFISETSPEGVMLREGSDLSVWVALSPNRLNYEISTNQAPPLRL